MPTNRRHRVRKLKLSITPYQTAYLLGYDLPEETAADTWWRIVGRHHRNLPTAERALWIEHRAELLAEFIRAHPGRRPQAWWAYDAPEDLPEGEDETAFLRRHGLLSAHEERRLARLP